MWKKNILWNNNSSILQQGDVGKQQTPTKQKQPVYFFHLTYFLVLISKWIFVRDYCAIKEIERELCACGKVFLFGNWWNAHIKNWCSGTAYLSQ